MFSGGMSGRLDQVNGALIHAVLTAAIHMVFNNAMKSDAELIDALGGPAKVAQLLGLGKAGGVQRVHNWKERGIPARIKLARPDLFVPGWRKTAKAA